MFTSFFANGRESREKKTKKKQKKDGNNALILLMSKWCSSETLQMPCLIKRGEIIGEGGEGMLIKRTSPFIVLPPSSNFSTTNLQY